MRGHSRSAFIAPTGRLCRSSLHRYASWMRSIRPSQHTSSCLPIFDHRDRTECICKSQTWLPACRDEYPAVNAELSRGAGPLAELMRGCSSIQGLISQVFNKKTKKSKIYKIYSEISSIPAQRLQPSSLIRADVSIHDQALHSLLGHKCIDLYTTDVKASERRAAASVLSI